MIQFHRVESRKAMEKAGVYLKETSSHPLEIDGAVVIRGDCVLSGKETKRHRGCQGGAEDKKRQQEYCL